MGVSGSGSDTPGVRAPVWLVACAFPPVGRGNSITNGCIARELAREFDVTVIAIEEATGVLLSYDTDPSLLTEDLGALSVRRFAAPSWLGLNEILYGLGVLPCYYLNWALRVWRRRHTLGPKPAAVIGIYPVLSDLLLAAALSRSLHVPLIVDFRDDFAGVMSRGWRRIYRALYERLECRLVRAATLVTVTTTELANDLADRHRVPRDRFRVLSNIVPANTAAPGSRDERESSSGVTVVYAGAMSAVQRPELLLQGYRSLLRRRPDLAGRLTVEMCGPENRYFRKRVEPEGGPGVRFLGFLPRAEVDAMMLRADVGYLGLSDDTFAYATPTKLFDYVEFGLPILGSLPRGAARRSVEESGLGIVCDDGDVEAVASGLERLCDEPGFRRACRERMSVVRGQWSAAIQGELWRTAAREASDRGPTAGSTAQRRSPTGREQMTPEDVSADAVERA